MTVEDVPNVPTSRLSVVWPQIHLLPVLARRLTHGRLRLTLPNGRTHDIDGPRPGPAASLTVRHPRFVRRLVLGGDLGFADAYIAGECDTDDLPRLLALALHNEAGLAAAVGDRPWLRPITRALQRWRANTRDGARRNIAAHYDLGNAFYTEWLDPTLTYSGAVFEHPGQELSRAQTAKYDRILHLADVRAHHHVLEVGCGWGGFAKHAARTIGCRVTAITISREQHAEATRRVVAAGLDDRVGVALVDYRDVTGTYDRVVSIEMIEAVGEAWWPTFFNTLAHRLTPGGQAVLQAITIADDAFAAYRRRADFIQRSVFPGGMLPSPSAIRERAQSAGLAVADRVSLGGHYAETLRRWRTAFEARWPDISRMGFDTRFRRLWRYYLAYCEAGFDGGRIDLEQIRLTRAKGGPA